jgi:hypothetical protein
VTSSVLCVNGCSEMQLERARPQVGVGPRPAPQMACEGADRRGDAGRPAEAAARDAARPPVSAIENHSGAMFVQSTLSTAVTFDVDLSPFWVLRIAAVVLLPGHRTDHVAHRASAGAPKELC